MNHDVYAAASNGGSKSAGSDDSDHAGPGGYLAVTGAGGSLGPHLAAALLAHSLPVALFTRSGKEQLALDGVAQLQASVGVGSGRDDGTPPEVAAFGVDLTDQDSVQAAFRAADERFGHPAALFNVAGGFTMRAADVSGTEDLERMLGHNFHSAVNATKAVLPGMLARRTGFVLAIGAGAARQPAPGRTAYAAAKGALAAYFRSLSAELRGTGVEAAILHPMGTIDTPPNRQAMPQADFSSWLSPAAVVEAALFLYNSKARVPELELFTP